MHTTEIENFLAQGLNRLGLSVINKPETLARLAIYFQELKKWNRKINLVARSQADKQILECHFLDSLTLLLMLPPALHRRETVLDVGTGAGFPGLVLKTVSPGLTVTLVEPRQNRFYFLKHMIRKLRIIGVEVLNEPLAEKAAVEKLSKRRFSFITSRAFTDTSRFVKLATPYLEMDGRIVLMKGPGAVNELNDQVGKGTGDIFFVTETRKIYLPFSKAERWLISIKRRGERYR